MTEKEKIKNNIKKIWINKFQNECIILTFIIFIPFLVGHYATDTYNIANIGYESYAINWSLKDGRLIMAGIGLIAGKINISIEAYVFITLFIALIISNITVIYLNNIIKKYKQPQNKVQEIILIAISYVTIFNFMYLENMYFVESIVMALSVLLFMISANILVERKNLSILKSLLLTILGIICYQGTVGMFFTFVILFTILKNKNNVKQILMDLLKSGIVGLVAVLLNVLTVKIIGNIFDLEQTRLGSISKVFSNIGKIIIMMPKILQETCNLFPKNALIMFLDILTIIVVIYEIKLFRKKKNDNILYKYIIILLITLLSSSLTYILTLTSFYTGRLRNALGALVGIIFLFLYVETELFEKKGKLNTLIILTFISYVIINIVNYENIILQHKEVNRLEKQEIEQLDSYIEQYEQETGIKVTQIIKVPVLKQTDKGYFEGTKNKTSFTHNALKTNWAVDGVINFYTERNLKVIKASTEQAEKYIKNQNNDLEYVCIDDILYVKIYLF